MIPYSRLFLFRKSICEVQIIRTSPFRTFFLDNSFLQNNSVQTLLVCFGLDFSFSEISIILISIISCKEVVVEEVKNNLSSKTINYSEISLESIYKIKLYSNIDGWINYIELNEYVNQLNLNDYSSLIDNKQYLIRFFNGIKNTIPTDINKPEIKSRLTVIETDFLRFESMLSSYESNEEEKVKMVKKINNSFSNLNFQIDKLTEKQEITPE